MRSGYLKSRGGATVPPFKVEGEFIQSDMVLLIRRRSRPPAAAPVSVELGPADPLFRLTLTLTEH
eukprot:gene15878-22008_t